MRFTRPGLSPLNHPEFRAFLLCRFFYIMAIRMVATAVAYQLFQLTKDSFAIGIVGLAEFIPVISLALYAGHVIDRSDKQKILVKGILGYLVCLVVLVAVTLPVVQKGLSTDATVWLFYAVIFGTGIIRAFTGPAFSAIIAQLVPRDELRFAASVSSTTWLSASILGHASAGFFLAEVGGSGTFIFAVSLVTVAISVLTRIHPKPIVHGNLTARTWDSVKEGLRFVFSSKILLGAISLDLFAVLFGGAVALVPEVAERILAVGPIGFGWLNAAMDIGSAIMLVTLTLSPFTKKQGYKLFGAVAGFGLCIIVFGLSKLYWVSFAALMLAGMLDGISVVIRGTILQLSTPDEMRGRVSSVNSIFINSSNELGQFESGFTTRIFGGAAPAILFGGCMTLAVAVITWLKAPALRKFEY